MSGALAGAAISALLGAVTASAQEKSTGETPTLETVVAEKTPYTIKRCVNFGNALDAPNEGDWGWTIAETDFDVARDAGFDTVRLPVRWSAHTGDAPEFTLDPEFAARVNDVISQALARDLTVIINVHHFDEIMESPREHLPKLLAIWAQLSERYKDLPQTVIFEPLNEPQKNLKGDMMREALVRAYKVIRRTNPNRLVMFGGEEWSSVRSLPTVPAIDDPNIIYTFHYYDPFPFTHQNAEWLGADMPKGARGWGDRADRDELARNVKFAKKVQEVSGTPVFLGEFGAIENAAPRDRLRYLSAVRTAYERAGIAWCLWNYKATFSLWDNDEENRDADQVEALGLNAPQ